MKPLGLILYSGPSQIDGNPIVCILTGTARRSKNAKTGAMLQTWIVRSDMHPSEAVKTRDDAAVCGDCPHRGNADGTGRTCYVRVGFAPGQVYRAYTAGRYEAPEHGYVASQAQIERYCAGMDVRLGSYGDPAAVLLQVWAMVARCAKARSGYTHQWRTALGARLRPYVMASCDSEQEALHAQSLGWRTFRVALPGDRAKLAPEATCPASKEAGAKLQCSTCRSCAGAAGGRRGSIVIQAHGSPVIMQGLAALRVRVQLQQSA